MMKKRLEKGCESGLLLLVILIIGYAHLAIGGVRQVDRIVLSSLTVLILFVWILRLWVLTKSRILIPPVTWGVILFAGYALWQYGRADVEYLARKEVVFCLIAAILFIVTVSSLHRQEASQWICVALVFLAMGTSIYAIYQYLTHSSFVGNIPQPIQYRDRASGTYINPNHFSGFLELVFPLCLSFVILGRFGHAPKILMGYAAVVMVGGIAVTFSRGGWVSFGLTVVLFSVFLLTQKDYRNRGVLMIVLGSLAVVGVFRKTDFDQSRFQTAFGDGHVQNVRLPIWEAAVNVFRNNNPWTGVGPGHFSAHWFRYRPEQVQTSAEHVHNDYLELLVNWGIIGVILVSLILILFFVGMARTWKFVKPEIKNFTVKHSTKAALVVGVCFSMTAILVHSFVDFNMHIPANALLVSLLLAISSGYCRFSTDAYWFRLYWPVKGVLTLVAISAAAFLISVIARELPSEREITRSGRESGFSEKLDHLQKAFEADPLNYITSQGIALRLILEIQALQNFQKRNSQINREIDAQIKRHSEKALTWLDRTLTLNPYHSKSLMWKGMCYHWLGRGEEALPFFEQAMELDPKSYFIVARFGYHHYLLKDYDEALKWLTESIRLTEFLSYYSVDPDKEKKYAFAQAYYLHVQRILRKQRESTAKKGVVLPEISD